MIFVRDIKERAAIHEPVGFEGISMCVKERHWSPQTQPHGPESVPTNRIAPPTTIQTFHFISYFELKPAHSLQPI